MVERWSKDDRKDARTNDRKDDRTDDRTDDRKMIWTIDGATITMFKVFS
jgi:hypothetical protein